MVFMAHPLDFNGSWILAISHLFIYQFGRSLQFWHLEFEKEAISDGIMAHSFVFRWEGFEFSSDLSELIFCGSMDF